MPRDAIVLGLVIVFLGIGAAAVCFGTRLAMKAAARRRRSASRNNLYPHW